MDTEKKGLEMLQRDLRKLQEKYLARAERKREKINDVYVTVQGEKCCTKEQIDDWYRYGGITMEQADRYIGRLEKKREKAGAAECTEYDHVCRILENYLFSISCDLEKIEKNCCYDLRA